MSLILEWSNEQDEVTIPEEWIHRLRLILHKAAESEQVADGEVALTFMNDAAIHELNKQYRGIDRPTDVLSFAMLEPGEEEMEIFFDTAESDTAAEQSDEESGEPVDTEQSAPLANLLGDIVISASRAKEQSEKYGHSLEREIGFLFIHGFLHLIGYDHQDEESEKEMFAKQEKILHEAGLTR